MFGEDKPTLVLSPQQRADWLRLIRTENVGPATFRKLLNRFGSAEAALNALPELSRMGGRNAPLKPPSQSSIEDEISGIEKHGGRVIALGEADYPYLLSHIPAAPPMIIMVGGQNINWRQTVGMVGARNASTAGQRITKNIAGDLGNAGYSLISGLARGIDAAAHAATLETGTVAVLAGGIDQVYPQENIPLSRQIVERGGALITEMPLGWEPRAKDFPRRNRLVSGMSLGVVVIEAARRSGSLITARLALEQNREVFAVPGSPLDPRAEGPNALIRDGATLVTNADHVIESLAGADPTRLPLFEEDAETQDFSMSADHTRDASDQDRSIILSALSPTPISVDELVQHTNISVPVLQVILMELDLAGRLEWASGQLVSLRQ